MKLLAATGNRDKLLELTRILEPLGVTVLTPADLGISTEVEETGATFAENARIKALAFYKLAGVPTVADDSGLCVDALGGRPGVYSARYLGEAPQMEKNAALLKELEATPEEKRGARFACAICCVLAEDDFITAEGVCEGKIAYSPNGEGGFGYDPIFLVNGTSFASLPPEEKDSCSHRGNALREFAKKLEAHLECKGTQIR